MCSQKAITEKAMPGLSKQLFPLFYPTTALTIRLARKIVLGGGLGLYFIVWRDT